MNRAEYYKSILDEMFENERIAQQLLVLALNNCAVELQEAMSQDERNALVSATAQILTTAAHVLYGREGEDEGEDATAVTRQRIYLAARNQVFDNPEDGANAEARLRAMYEGGSKA